MPFGDGTGPLGQGPTTGRGLGYCSGYNQPGYSYSRRGWFGRGFGRGRGWFGRGMGMGRRWFWQSFIPYQTPTTKEEVDILKEEASVLRQELKEIESAIQDLKTKKKK